MSADPEKRCIDFPLDRTVYREKIRWHEYCVKVQFNFFDVKVDGKSQIFTDKLITIRTFHNVINNLNV